MYNLVKYDSFQLYINEINKYEVLTPEEEMFYAKKWYDEKDISSAQKLIKHNLKFVLHIAFGFRGYGLSIEDIVQEGNIGLMCAVKKFNPYKGFKLISYAKFWIISYIQTYILKAWSIVNMATKGSHRAVLFGHQNTIEHHNKDEIKDIEYAMSGRNVSLNEPFRNDNGEYELIDSIECERSNQELQLIDIEETMVLSNRISKALSCLNERELDFVQSRLMYEEEHEKLTLRELAEKWNISKERARQIEESIIKKLRVLLSEQYNGK